MYVHIHQGCKNKQHTGTVEITHLMMLLLLVSRALSRYHSGCMKLLGALIPSLMVVVQQVLNLKAPVEGNLVDKLLPK